MKWRWQIFATLSRLRPSGRSPPASTRPSTWTEWPELGFGGTVVEREVLHVGRPPTCSRRWRPCWLKLLPPVTCGKNEWRLKVSQLVDISSVIQYIHFRINIAHIQCDQIGRFLKLLGDNCYAKVAKIFGDFWSNFEIFHFQVKLLFGQLLESLGVFLFQHLVTRSQG